MILKIKTTLLILLVLGCSKNGNNIEIHPSQENLLNNKSISAYISSEDIVRSSEEIGFLDRFKNKTLISQIGRLDGSEEQIFSSIDQVIIKNGKVIIFDGNNFSISIFDLNGNFIKRFNQLGKGPGEVISPTGIAVHENNLFLADRMYSVKISNLNADSLFFEDFLSNLPGLIESICVLKNTVTVKSIFHKEENPGNDKLMHKYDLYSKEKISSFGSAYKVKDPTAREILSEGIFSCDSKGDKLANSFFILPYIYLYNSNGEIEWITELKDYQPLKFKQEKGYGMTTRWDNSDFEYDEYRTLFFLKDYLFLQTERYSNLFNKGEIEIKSKYLRSYLINKENGKGFYLGEEIPQLLFIDDNYAVLNNNKEYPGITIYRL